jgi:hypothetical protein
LSHGRPGSVGDRVKHGAEAGGVVAARRGGRMPGREDNARFVGCREQCRTVPDADV